jgi:hypothetical protein
VALWGDLAGVWWSKYRGSPLWAAGRRHEFRWYLWWFGKYGIMWDLFPLAAVLAIATRRTVSLFCVAVFGVAFVLQSGGGTKGDRYIYYALPFFFAVWAIILADVSSLLAAKIRNSMIPLRWRVRRPAASQALAVVLVGAIALFGAREIRAFKTTVQMLDPRPDTRRPYEGRGADWPAATPYLRKLSDSADVIVSSAGPKSLYYLGRLDVELSASMLADLRRPLPPRDFTMDRRTGRPLISRPESLRGVMECSRSGLVIAEEGHLLTEEWIPKSTAAYLAEHAEEISVPRQWHLKVFAWHHAQPAPHDGCPPWRVAARAPERKP